MKISRETAKAFGIGVFVSVIPWPLIYPEYVFLLPLFVVPAIFLFQPEQSPEHHRPKSEPEDD